MTIYNIYEVNLGSTLEVTETSESVIAKTISQMLREHDCDIDYEFKLVAIKEDAIENSLFGISNRLCSTLQVNSTSAAEWDVIRLKLMGYLELMGKCLSYLEHTFNGLQVEYEHYCQELEIPNDFIFINYEEYRAHLDLNVENMMNFIRSKYFYQTI